MTVRVWAVAAGMAMASVSVSSQAAVPTKVVPAKAAPAKATAGKPAAAKTGQATVRYGPAPAWVRPLDLPPTPVREPGASYAMRLSDTQVAFTATGYESYYEYAFEVTSEDGLEAGTLNEEWDPETETVTVNRLNVLRDGKVIDVLKADTFQVLRRETNLDSAMLDGRLTATLQVKDLRVGDTIDMAVTRAYREPLVGGRSEWNWQLVHAGVAGRARLRALWTADRPMRWLKGSDLPAPVVTQTADGGGELVLDLTSIKAPKAPEGAPMRYADLNNLALTAFTDWSQVSALMAPLYRKAATLEPDSPLKAEAARIRAASPDPAVRAALALKLVQSQVRYVFVGLDGGALEPAKADDSWRHRFGDCKGKTALLLALLAQLDIPAEPALVNSSGYGDGLDKRLPGLGGFDHVIARAVIGGKVYWLDGTRTGDETLARIETPRFRWALPLRAEGGALEKMELRPASRPFGQTILTIDASKGADAPADVTLQAVFRGDQAIEANRKINAGARDETKRASLRAWSTQLPWIEFTDVDWSFDATGALFTQTLHGKGEIHWWPISDGVRQWDLDGSSVGYDSFERDADQNAEAPYALAFPYYMRWVTAVILPGKGEGFVVKGKEIDETAGGSALRRVYESNGGQVVMLTSARSLVPEISAAEAKASTMKAKRGIGVLAIQAVPPAAGKDGKDAQAPSALVQGYTAAEAGREDDALRLFEKARDAAPTQTRPWEAILGVHMRRKAYDRALAICDQAAKKDVDHADTWKANRAWVLVQADRVDAAVAELTTALAASPSSTKLLLALADAHEAQAKPDLATQDLDRAVAAAPTDLDVLRARADHAMTIKDYADAVRRYEAIVALKPENPYVVMGLSRAYAAAGNPDEALRQADEALRIDPFNWPALIQRSGVNLDTKHHELALADADRALALHPEVPILWNQRCWVRAVWGQELDKAISDCDAGLKLAPKSAATLDSRALVRFRQAQYDAAVRDYDAALALSPKQAASLYGRGLTKLKLGQKDAGQADLAAAAAIEGGIGKRFEGYGLKPELGRLAGG